jgi:hypothetical protein
LIEGRPAGDVVEAWAIWQSSGLPNRQCFAVLADKKVAEYSEPLIDALINAAVTGNMAAWRYRGTGMAPAQGKADRDRPAEGGDTYHLRIVPESSCPVIRTFGGSSMTCFVDLDVSL